jgi:hypothetical protein
MSRGLGKNTRALRGVIERVLFEKYADLPMSSRQVFYQCLGHPGVNYGLICRTLVNMRRDGSVPYTRIVDRTRRKHQRASWDSAKELLDACARQFRRDLWADQDTIPMVGCEKQALEGIFAGVCDEFGAQLWIIRGFSSESFDYEWSEEIKELTAAGKRVCIGYFGDHDPSGHYIEQASIRKLRGFGANVEWTRIGLLPTDPDESGLTKLPVKRTPQTKSFRAQIW